MAGRKGHSGSEQAYISSGPDREVGVAGRDGLVSSRSLVPADGADGVGRGGGASAGRPTLLR